MRRLIVVVLALTLVLVGLDVAARAAAEAAVARQVQSSEGLARRPTVEISGFPFLLQAIGGVYRQVDVHLQGVPAGDELRLDELDARLTGIHLPLSTLFGTATTDTRVDAAHVTATVTYAALDAQVSAATRNRSATVHFADGGDGRLRASVNYTGLGGPITVSGTARLTIDRGRLIVTMAEQDLARIPEPLRTAVRPLLTQTVQLPKLPFGLVPTAVTVTGQGITAAAEARDTVLPAESRS